ncbi:MAG: TOMM precursor leader peptide-binding protein [Deltaproteobacteria bacterium]|nr:TOMM precursor leader peptide-binding protein [Deltaproteobacteria bacterium]
MWLIASEDVRYRLGVDGDPGWLRDVLVRCDGRSTLAEILAMTAPDDRSDASAILERLYEERVMLDGSAAQAHVAAPAAYRVTGHGALAERLQDGATSDAVLEVFAQDRLDLAALLAHNARAIAERRRWMWVTTGPGERAYVGPLIVPDAGPCAMCLVVHFKRLSPVPAIYDALLAHAAPIAVAEFPVAAVEVTAALARWKLGLVAEPVAPAALYALHVIERGDLTIASHVPLADPECAGCRA